MQSNEFYFLVMVCGIFVAFGAGLAVNYIQYRRWVKQVVQPSLKSRRLVDQFLRGDIQQLVLGGAVEHPFLADLQQHRHGERRDALEPAMCDTAPRAAQQSPRRCRSVSCRRRPRGWRAAGCGRAGAGAARRRSGRSSPSPAGAFFSAPGMLPLDQPGDHRDVAEGAAQHRVFRPSRPPGRRPACPGRTARRAAPGRRLADQMPST